MISPPPTQEIRAPGNSGVSVQDGKENIGIVDRTLDIASFWKLKICKINQRERTTSIHRLINNTNLGVCNVICHYAHSASGGLSNGRVPETELLEQERVVTKHVCGTLCTHERRDRVSLGIVVIRISYNLVCKFRGGMHAQ